MFITFFLYIYEEGVVKTRNLLGEGVIGVIIFSSIRFLSKKITKSNFFKKNRNQSETGLARFFSGLGLVQFGFFSFKLIKPKPNRTGRFF